MPFTTVTWSRCDKTSAPVSSAARRTACSISATGFDGVVERFDAMGELTGADEDGRARVHRRMVRAAIRTCGVDDGAENG